MKRKLPKTKFRKITSGREDITFPGRKSLLETLERQLGVVGNIWIHHAYRVPSEEPVFIEESRDLQYQDTVIIPSILHTLIDKMVGDRTASLSSLSGMRNPELLFVLDPAEMNLAIIFKGKLWITEILLKEAASFYPTPSERRNALTNIISEIPHIETSQEDVAIEIDGHRTEEGIEQDNIFIPLDSNYKPVLGGKDPTSRLKLDSQRLLETGELIMMISDAISSSAKMYLGTVNVRLSEDKAILEYPRDVNIASLKIYKRFIDVIEVSSPSPLQNIDLQRIIFRIYRTKFSRSLNRLIKMLHI